MKDVILTGTLGTTHPYIDERLETEYWHHRSSWMEDMLAASVSWFEKLFGRAYSARILTANGSGAREAFVTNLATAGDLVWASAGSDFSDIARCMGMIVTELSSSLPKEVPDLVLIDHVREDGTLVNLKPLVDRIRRAHPRAPIVVDLSTSFGADAVDIANLGCDGYVTVPERSLGSIPGASVAVFRDSVRKRILEVRTRSSVVPYTFDLLKYDKAWQKVTTPFSPNISTSVGLATSIELIERNGGLSAHVGRHATFARLMRKALAARGCTVLPGKKTNAYTIVDLPHSVRAKALVAALERSGIGIELFPVRKNAVRVGHMGYLTDTHFNRFFTALEKVLPGNTPSMRLAPVVAPPSWDPNIARLCTIAPEEFVAEATSAAARHTRNRAYQEKIQASARKAFQTHRDYSVYGCHTTRTLGFIGAGNTVRASVALCLEAGIRDIVVYSPTLAALKKRGVRGQDVENHETLEYWERRGVRVALSSEEVFMTAHTVVLLPTYYTKHSAKLLGMPPSYVNHRMVNDVLLKKIRDKGKMDLLVNASAREGLIDRTALARHLKEGWLLYYADELPPVDDPVLREENAYLTGHVAGSPQLTKERIAKNTHELLVQVLTELATGSAPAKEMYTVNVLNAHLEPRGGWRMTAGGVKEIRVLLSDPFDTKTLDFLKLSRVCGVRIVVKDISKEPKSAAGLERALRSFRPHVLMIRTNTVITARTALVMSALPEFAALVRPGVGIDNVYDGMRGLSAAGVKVMNEPYGNSFSVGEMVLHMVLNGVRRTLLTPGPTQFKSEVFAVMNEYTYPTSRRYEAAHRTMARMLRPWMDRGTIPLVQSAPSTGFMEASVTNLTEPGDRGLVVAHGKFGNRFIEIARATGRAVDYLAVSDAEWGQPFSPTAIAQALKRSPSPYAFLSFQQNETSSGVAYNEDQVRAIVKAARSHNPDIMIIVDGVSGVGAHALDFRSLDIDAVIVGSQKAFGVSSGLSFLALSPRAVRTLVRKSGYKGSLTSLQKDARRERYLDAFETKQRVRYLSLLRLLFNEPIDVPVTFHILSTLASLECLKKEGGPRAVFARHRELASYTRAQVAAMRLKTLSRKPFMSDSVTPVLLPADKDASLMRQRLLEEYGFSVAGSQIDYWKRALIRIGHVGYVYHSDIVRCMRALRILLR